MLTNSMLLESTPAITQERVAETDLSLPQIALRSGISDQSRFLPVEELDRFAQVNYDKRVIHSALRWLLDRPRVGVAPWGARHPDQLRRLADVMGWRIDADAMVAKRQSLIQSGLSLRRRQSATLHKKPNLHRRRRRIAGQRRCVSGF
jgi:hypothetical protein